MQSHLPKRVSGIFGVEERSKCPVVGFNEDCFRFFIVVVVVGLAELDE